MKICIVGTGYVGLSAGICLASIGHNVICIDSNKNKIENLKKGIIEIYEPKMQELLLENKKNIKFTTNLEENIKNCEICFITVGTPTLENNEVDTSQVEFVAKIIVENIENYAVIINKSTVPVGYNRELKSKLQSFAKCEFDIVSNPEFLKQGSAIDDFLNPERIIIGSSSQKAIEKIKELYKPLNLKDEQILIMDVNSAELTKYACNSFLALKISFMNEIANLCEKTAANIENIKKGMASDLRIGKSFLNAGLGYGGSCFPKDTRAILNIAKEQEISLKTIESTIEINENQIELFVEKIIKHYDNKIENKTFALWGIAFKPNTNDTREAPSLKIIDKLKAKGAKIKAYDPKAKIEGINQVNSAKETIINSDALIIATEWEEFKNYNPEELQILKDKVIFDGRNIFINKNLNNYELRYYCIGKNE